MEDSIELSGSDRDIQEINFYVSPQHSNTKQHRPLQHTASQQSLAYSNSTHQFNIRTQRSPIDIPAPIFQSSKKSEDLKKMLRAAKSNLLTQNQFSLANQMEDKSPQMKKYREERKKTVNKKQIASLEKRNKQLQYALHYEIITSEELRTKVNVLSELLEQQIKVSQLSYLLGLKNTSKNMKNIDIFVELKQCQNKLKEKSLIISQQKQQIQNLKQKRLSLSAQRRILTTQKKVNEVNEENLDIQSLQNDIRTLQEEKQSLFQYIQQLENKCNEKVQIMEQLQKQILHYQEKQQKFITMQRPKLIHELQQKIQKIRQLQQQKERDNMQHNLIVLHYQNQIQNISKQPKQNTNKKQIGVMHSQENRAVHTQTQDNGNRGILKAQLNILKNQRDYYIAEYKKKVQECADAHSLRLQIKVLQSQLNQLLQ